MATITVGDVVRVDCTFSVDGTDSDPTTIIFKYQPPGEPLVLLTSGVDAALVNDATGKYHVDITTDRPGAYLVEYEGTGNVNASRGSVFNVVKQGVDL